MQVTAGFYIDFVHDKIILTKHKTLSLAVVNTCSHRFVALFFL
jgi:hypothetical protein